MANLCGVEMCAANAVRNWSSVPQYAWGVLLATYATVAGPVRVVV